jgi:hypothetical protein
MQHLLILRDGEVCDGVACTVMVHGGAGPAICVETRHMQAVLKAPINKTDRNDARGIAQMMRGRGFIVRCM